LQKSLSEAYFAKEVRKRKFCQTVDDAIAHANGPHGLLEEKQARIVVTSAAAALVLLALESCKNMRLILAGCHWRRVLFKINKRSTPPSLIQLIPPPQHLPKKRSYKIPKMSPIRMKKPKRKF
jgi:hypothetical protein